MKHSDGSGFTHTFQMCENRSVYYSSSTAQLKIKHTKEVLYVETRASELRENWERILLGWRISLKSTPQTCGCCQSINFGICVAHFYHPVNREWRISLTVSYLIRTPMCQTHYLVDGARRQTPFSINLRFLEPHMRTPSWIFCLSSLSFIYSLMLLRNFTSS